MDESPLASDPQAQKNPAARGFLLVKRGTDLQFLRLHKLVESHFSKTKPQVFIAKEDSVVVVDLFEVGVLGANFFVQSHGFFEGQVHHVLGERQNLGVGTHQLLERHRVLDIVLGLHGCVGKRCRAFDDDLVLGRQGVEGLVVDEEVQLWTAFPPTRVVVEGCNLVEAQLLVVVGANPLSGVNGSFSSAW